MKKLLTIFAVILFTLTASLKVNAQKSRSVHVKSYTTKKGKHVNSHYRSRPSRHKKYSYARPFGIIGKEQYA
jgi:hypothetical protein